MHSTILAGSRRRRGAVTGLLGMSLFGSSGRIPVGAVIGAAGTASLLPGLLSSLASGMHMFNE